MTRQEAIETQIDEIMDCFDFRKVADHMEQTGWKWHDEIPCEPDIRHSCRTEMRKLAATGEEGYYSGGFLIRFIENKAENWLRFDLKFVIADWPMDGTEYSI